MIDVNVKIGSIVQNCDESLLALSTRNGYSFVKKSSDNLWFWDRITDNRGKLTYQYFNSRMNGSHSDEFICLWKEDSFQIAGPQPIIDDKGGFVLSDKEFSCEDQLFPFQNRENQYLNEFFGLLRIYKAGNIGRYETFFDYNYFIWLANHTISNRSVNESRNNIGSRKYILDKDEVLDCNTFIIDYSGGIYTMLQSPINEFLWGLEQIDIATGFEQYTTALEMLILERNTGAIKQKLSKRVAVLLGKDSIEVRAIYKRMLDYYRFRSESLHEGDSSNISINELHELENTTRCVLKKTMEKCRIGITSSSSLTWDSIKAANINHLKAEVQTAIANGVLPA